MSLAKIHVNTCFAVHIEDSNPSLHDPIKEIEFSLIIPGHGSLVSHGRSACHENAKIKQRQSLSSHEQHYNIVQRIQHNPRN